MAVEKPPVTSRRGDEEGRQPEKRQAEREPPRQAGREPKIRSWVQAVARPIAALISVGF